MYKYRNNLLYDKYASEETEECEGEYHFINLSTVSTVPIKQG
jgi:hypothetical protein